MENTPSQSVEIDVRFYEFYNLMGGRTTLGQSIGPLFNDGTRQYQFTENALLVYDEQRPTGERFNFEPLGALFGVQDATLPIPEGIQDIRYLNGHVIFADFIPLFDQLGGLRFVGNPLTEVRLNTEKSRYEQFFEKMGFYRNLGDAPNVVRLLPYGLIACRQLRPELGCKSNLTDAIIESDQYLPQPFLPVVQRLGENFTGAPLSQPYQTPDGRLEQIYENIVLAFDPNNLRTIALRDLPSRIGLTSQPLVPPLNDPLMAFIVLDNANNLGHNVPKAFLEYIVVHGGIELSGPPTSELHDVNGIRRQCFTTYCLDYDPSAPGETQIHPAPLGYQYQTLQGYTTAQFHLRVWETEPVIGIGQGQIIGVMVYNGIPDQPMQDIQPTITITWPNGQSQSMTFPPTSMGGTTYLQIPAASGPGGTVVYEVCASQPGSEPLCVKESWIVR